ncbi:MAG: hypothetical protein VB024_04410 [Dysgonamonadaceae bacterium]|jgi:hypothetical protein|nr:hypothetical protein [Dysgonamonadaceae bacterium]MDD3309575.1 hypothetical protein [Dysgonamonadaceae bacterium]MDD3901057.1 hypothetical protein [Dysgonamonadaceae bacterium]MDD4399118.1 hypothetical protein [Dysgonamonadaceae bacterium]MEA5080853.1 hypothetical protein [Dysgonamonadaceae bacterium]
MIRHPKNEYDEFAIGIYFNDIKIEWVMQELNQVISRLMDAGKVFFCRIILLNDKKSMDKNKC